MREFQVDGKTIKAYLAVPKQGSGPGVMVLHAWWGLTEPFQQVCDRLAEAGFVALAPDLYHGETAATIEEAETLMKALSRDEKRSNDDIDVAMQVLRQHAAGDYNKFGVIGFSLGGAYALDMSVNRDEEIAAVVIFYATYTGLDFGKAKAAYLFNFAEDDPFEPAESAAEMEQELKAAGRTVTAYTYPGTHHWFFEQNRPEYNAEAAGIAWQRTIDFLHERLD
jgi:carboxymethylenebutenolidase